MTTETNDRTATDASLVELTVPADIRFLRLARLTTAGLAADLKFGVDGVEDLRLAVDEASAVLLGCAAPAARFVLRSRLDGQQLVITGECPHAASVSADEQIVHSVTEAVLAATVDSYQFTKEDGVGSFRIVKRLPT